MNDFDAVSRNNEELIIDAVLNATDNFALSVEGGEPAADPYDSPEDSVLTVDSVLRIRSELTGSLPVVAVTKATIRDAGPEDEVAPGQPLRNPLPQPETALRRRPGGFPVPPADAGDGFPEMFLVSQETAGDTPDDFSGAVGEKETRMKEFDLSIGENDDFDLK